MIPFVHSNCWSNHGCIGLGNTAVWFSKSKRLWSPHHSDTTSIRLEMIQIKMKVFSALFSDVTIWIFSVFLKNPNILLFRAISGMIHWIQTMRCLRHCVANFMIDEIVSMLSDLLEVAEFQDNLNVWHASSAPFNSTSAPNYGTTQELLPCRVQYLLLIL